jgi:hypothetical protein
MIELNKFLENINYINESIDRLIYEQGIIGPPPDGVRTVKQKFIVIEDGKTPKDTEITLKDAKVYKNDAKVGDEIEVPVIDFEDMTDTEVEEKLRELTNDGKISWKDVEQIAVGATSTKLRRTAVGVIKLGPKVIAGAGRLMLLGKLKKKIPHSQCFCVKLFDDNKDETLTPPKPSRGIYESSLVDYIDTVRNEFLEGWDECEEKYKKFIDDETERTKAIDACPAVEDFFSNAKTVLDSILSSMSKYFDVSGIDVEKKSLAKGEKSVAKTIGSHEKIQLHFTKTIPSFGGGGTMCTNCDSGDDEVFDIGTYKEEGKVVRLVLGSDTYYFQFDTAVPKKEQTGSVWKDDGTGKPGTNTVSWQGWIIKFFN